MTGESEFLALLKGFANSPAARGFSDDAAVLEFAGKRLVLTHDMIVEGVHFLPDEAPEDVAWKLLAVNLSDLAAKGAAPLGVLLGYTLAQEDDWDRAFLEGLWHALLDHSVPLLGGDTVSAPPGTRRSFGMTAIGEAAGPVPARGGAQDGDILFVSGSIGGAGAGLRVALGQLGANRSLLERYRRPQPRIAAGRALAPIVRAMMDVSDGLLIDAARMAEASGLGLQVELADVPLDAALDEQPGGDLQLRLEAVIAGDDYELLFAAAPDRRAEIAALSADLGLPFAAIGRFHAGSGLAVAYRGTDVPLPARLGFEHGG